MKFEDIDFNKLYMEQKEASSFKIKSKESWDTKADSMNKKVHKSIYNQQFLKLLNLEGIQTLLDVGCGVGNLSLKLASKLLKVYSLDYSSRMLELLNENAKKFIPSLIATADGMYLQSITLENYNLKENLIDYIKMLDELLQK